jgi:hypothetical protein
MAMISKLKKRCQYLTCSKRKFGKFCKRKFKVFTTNARYIELNLPNKIYVLFNFIESALTVSYINWDSAHRLSN